MLSPCHRIGGACGLATFSFFQPRPRLGLLEGASTRKLQSYKHHAAKTPQSLLLSAVALSSDISRANSIPVSLDVSSSEVCEDKPILGTAIILTGSPYFKPARAQSWTTTSLYIWLTAPM